MKSFLSRRAFCAGAAPLLLLPNALWAQDLPDCEGQLEDGSQANLRRLTEGKAVALQFVFTTCVTLCPLMGALFRAVQRDLDATAREGCLLLSVSVDPEHDTPSKLRRFLEKNQAEAGWRALLLARLDLDRLLLALGEEASSPTLHSPQTIVFDRRGAESARFRELGKAPEIAQALRAAAR